MRLIDAEALKRKAQKVAVEAWKMKMTAQVETVMNQFIDFLDEQPAIDAEPVRRGRWEPCKASIHPYGNDVRCTVCDARMGSSFGYRYCPYCGARMDGENDAAD